MKYVNILSFTIDNLKRRIIKFLGSGLSDNQTAIEAGPYGIDSAPIKGMVAIYAPTSTNGKSTIIGYLNVNQISKIGEFRCYSTDSNGGIKSAVYLQNTGVIKVDGESIQIIGNVDNAVKYIPLNAGLQTEAGTINTNLVSIAAAITALGALLGQPPLYAPTAVSIDISASKINEIKVP